MDSMTIILKAKMGTTQDYYSYIYIYLYIYIYKYIYIYI